LLLLPLRHLRSLLYPAVLALMLHLLALLYFSVDGVKQICSLLILRKIVLEELRASSLLLAFPHSQWGQEGCSILEETLLSGCFYATLARMKCVLLADSIFNNDGQGFS